MNEQPRPIYTIDFILSQIRLKYPHHITIMVVFFPLSRGGEANHPKKNQPRVFFLAEIPLHDKISPTLELGHTQTFILSGKEVGSLDGFWRVQKGTKKQI